MSTFSGRARGRQRLVAGALVALLVLSACGSDDDDASASGTTDGDGVAEQPAERQSLVVAHGNYTVSNAVLFVAAEAGYLDELGLDVENVNFQNTDAAIAAMVSGEVDLVVGGTHIVFTSQMGETEPMQCLAVTKTGQAWGMVLSNAAAEAADMPEDPTPEERVEAIDGLRIATPDSESGYTALLNANAEAAGVTVENVYVASNALNSALVAGDIDGFVSTPPITTTAVAEGFAVEWISGPDEQWLVNGGLDEPAGGCVIASSAFIDENEEVVVSYIAGMNAAQQLIEDDPDRALELIGGYFEDIEPDVLRETWDQTAHLIVNSPSLHVDADVLQAMLDATPDAQISQEERSQIDVVGSVLPESIYEEADAQAATLTTAR